jgi:hypothetical protein
LSPDRPNEAHFLSPSGVSRYLADVMGLITLGDSGVAKRTLIRLMKTGLCLDLVIPPVTAGVASIEVRIVSRLCRSLLASKALGKRSFYFRD